MNIFCRTSDGKEHCASFLTYNNLFGKIINSQVRDVPVLDSVVTKLKAGSEVIFTLKNNIEENEVPLMSFIEELAMLIDYAMYKRLDSAEDNLIYRLTEYVAFAFNTNAELVISSS